MLWPFGLMSEYSAANTKVQDRIDLEFCDDFHESVPIATCVGIMYFYVVAIDRRLAPKDYTKVAFEADTFLGHTSPDADTQIWLYLVCFKFAVDETVAVWFKQIVT